MKLHNLSAGALLLSTAASGLTATAASAQTKPAAPDVISIVLTPEVDGGALQFLRVDSELKRALTVLKTRGSAHLQQLRQFEITADGAVLGEPFDSRQSLD